MYRGQYDPLTALTSAGRLMCLELKPCGDNRLCGPYYLSGEPHPWRKDKLKVFISRGCVWVAEEGGRCISLPQWMIEFGHAADWKEAIKMIKSGSGNFVWDGVRRSVCKSEVRYVERAALVGAKAYPLESCSLFRWMCGLFSEERVRAAWDLYNVTTDAHGNAVFWYVDQSGNVLFDKRIAYKENGHRNKAFFPARVYRVDEGYRGKCYFGACVPQDGKKTFVVESEKSALLAYLYYGRRFLACGGINNLREVDENMLLLPDMDARAEWAEKGQVWPWWEQWGLQAGEIPEKADIGDMVEWRMRR